MGSITQVPRVVVGQDSEKDPPPKDSPLFRASRRGSQYLPTSGRVQRRYESTLGSHYKHQQARQIFNRNPTRMYGFVWNR